VKGPTLIVLSGMPGTGKSTLAEAFSRRTGAPIFSVDPIESAMLDAGMRRSFDTGLAAYLVAQALADNRLRLGHDAIVDAVNCVRYSKRMWSRLAARHRAKLRIVECVCSDEVLHRRRLTRRRRGLSAKLREPSWNDVVKRKRDWVPWTSSVLVIDAAKSLRSNMLRVSRWLATSR
jgi:predicted kinase